MIDIDLIIEALGLAASQHGNVHFRNRVREQIEELRTPKVFIVLWRASSADPLQAQAYWTREAAERDYAIGEDIVESTVQR